MTFPERKELEPARRTLSSCSHSSSQISTPFLAGSWPVPSLWPCAKRRARLQGLPQKESCKKRCPSSYACPRTLPKNFQAAQTDQSFSVKILFSAVSEGLRDKRTANHVSHDIRYLFLSSLLILRCSLPECHSICMQSNLAIQRAVCF